MVYTPPTLNSILLKIRKLIGGQSALQVPDQDLMDYINSFYLYDMPAHFRSLKLKDQYVFTTVQGQATYPFDSENYTTVQNPVYCAKREIQLFYDPWGFYRVNYNWQQQTNFTFGDGTVGPYTGFTTASPLIGSVNNDPTNVNYPAGRVQNILITANTATGTLNVTDIDQGNGFGLLYEQIPLGTAAPNPLTFIGAINYFTGEILGLTFPQIVPQGNPIQIQYIPVVEGIPLSIMFFQNQFTLRPVPSQGFTVELIAYRQPTQAIANLNQAANSPELSEWWELISVGAAKKFFEDSLDLESAKVMESLLFERYSVAETRTYAQIGQQRVQTIYQDQLNNSYTFGFGVFGSGGP